MITVALKRSVRDGCDVYLPKLRSAWLSEERDFTPRQAALSGMSGSPARLRRIDSSTRGRGGPNRPSNSLQARLRRKLDLCSRGNLCGIFRHKHVGKSLARYY